MRLIFILLGLFCAGDDPIIIKFAGALKDIMREGNLSSTIQLDTIAASPNLIGLGVVENLKGEIIIIDGHSYVSSIESDLVQTRETNQLRAAMLVYGVVDEWNSGIEGKRVSSLKEMESYVEEAATSMGVNTQEPFPFLVKVRKGAIHYHIIDWNKNVIHTPSNHKQFAKFAKFENEGVFLLGFYSKKHAGIFTPHSSFIHLHAINESKTVVGHVDELTLPGGYELIFPVNEK